MRYVLLVLRCCRKKNGGKRTDQATLTPPPHRKNRPIITRYTVGLFHSRGALCIADRCCRESGWAAIMLCGGAVAVLFVALFFRGIRLTFRAGMKCLVDPHTLERPSTLNTCISFSRGQRILSLLYSCAYFYYSWPLILIYLTFSFPNCHLTMYSPIIIYLGHMPIYILQCQLLQS